MFEKFNDAARRAIARSADEARTLGHSGIGTDHLLVALTAATDGEPNKALTVILSLRILPRTVRDAALAGMPTKDEAVPGSHMPFSPDLKRALESSARTAGYLGDNYIGPEHLLAGLVEDTASNAGKVLATLDITHDKVIDAIRQLSPAHSPTGERACTVYLPAGKSIFKNGARIYPDLETAQAGHPGEEIAAFTIPLLDGEFFDVCTMYPRYSSWGRFASYPDAFAAAEELRDVRDTGLQIRIMVPKVEELRGKDSRGHDVVLGRAVEYSSTRIMTRLFEASEAGRPAGKEDSRV